MTASASTAGGNLDANNNVVAQFVYADKVNVPEYMVRFTSTIYRLITDHLGGNGGVRS